MKVHIKTLHHLAYAINRHGTHSAEVQKSWSNTDYKPRGCRFITRKGKGRKGLRIKVRNATGEVVMDHDTSETYRTVSEAVDLALKVGAVKPKDVGR